LVRRGRLNALPPNRPSWHGVGKYEVVVCAKAIFIAHEPSLATGAVIDYLGPLLRDANNRTLAVRPRMGHFPIGV